MLSKHLERLSFPLSRVSTPASFTRYQLFATDQYENGVYTSTDIFDNSVGFPGIKLIVIFYADLSIFFL